MMSKKEVLELVRKAGYELRYASPEFQKEEKIVLEAVRNDGNALEYAAPECQAERRIVLEAVRNNGTALEWASEELRADKEVVLEAVRNNGWALEHASAELRGCKEIAIEAAKCTVWALQYAEIDLLTDKDFALAAARCIKHDLDVLAFCKVEGDERIFQEAVEARIAAPGEEAPVLTVALHCEPPLRGSEDATDTERQFKCEVNLLSGVTFECLIADDTACKGRGCPNLKQLAAKVVEDLPKHTSMRNVKRIFLNFATSEDSDALPVSPWDWNRPLTDFLVSPGSTDSFG